MDMIGAEGATLLRVPFVFPSTTVRALQFLVGKPDEGLFLIVLRPLQELTVFDPALSAVFDL